MRILLLTDSLGCPRSNINVTETWVYNIMKKWASEDVVIYTYCKHGLYANDVDINYIREIEPDVIFTQIGIVDACRRALKKSEVSIISKIPKVRNIIHEYCKKNHYYLTSKREIHDSSKEEFLNVINELKHIAKKQVVYIVISNATAGLTTKVFNVNNDIDEYNSTIITNSDAEVINPYEGINPEEYLLEDGHHLNLFGNELVFKKVDSILQHML